MLIGQRSYQCINNHGFDIAKEGYVNLLLAHQKHSQQPGDNYQMIKSRRSFLEKGYYNPLIDHLKDLILPYSSTIKEYALLDAGCGEGYYLGQLLNQIKSRVNAFGMDISKEAIKLAAKRYRKSFFVVGSIAQLPFLDSSIDMLINIFAPRNPFEFHRALAADGCLLLVTPAEGHLQQLREIIYDKVTAYNVTAEDDLVKHFYLKETREVSFNLVINAAQDITELLQMTPFYWSASQEAQERIMKLNQLETTIAFSIQLYQKI